MVLDADDVVVSGLEGEDARYPAVGRVARPASTPKVWCRAAAEESVSGSWWCCLTQLGAVEDRESVLWSWSGPTR